MYQNTAIWQNPDHKITEETLVYIWLENGIAKSSLEAPDKSIPHWRCYGQAEAQEKLASLRTEKVQAA